MRNCTVISLCVFDNRHTRLFSVIDDVLKQRKMQLPYHSSADVRCFLCSFSSLI